MNQIISLNSLLLLVLIALIVFLIYYIKTNRSTGIESKEIKDLIEQLNLFRQEIQHTSNRDRSEIQDRIDKIQTNMMQSMHKSSQSIQDVTKQLTKLDETNKQVLNFSEQLESLQNILKNPKQRGILGEYWLETLLAQVLQPTQYSMQHDLGINDETGNKLIPDAVIFIRDMLIPIDAKFSLENYNKITQESDLVKREILERDFKSDVKKRIDETSKYIQIDRGTTNFAFMFVPAEGVYHNLITSNVGAVQVNSRNLIEYAFEKGVMIVSPTSFFAYLQTVILGLKALKIEESVKDIQKHAEQLMRHVSAYEDYHNKVGKHLETTYRAYSASSKELKKIDKDIYRITDGEAGKQLDPVEIELPMLDE